MDSSVNLAWEWGTGKGKRSAKWNLTLMTQGGPLTQSLAGVFSGASVLSVFP